MGWVLVIFVSTGSGVASQQVPVESQDLCLKAKDKMNESSWILLTKCLKVKETK